MLTILYGYGLNPLSDNVYVMTGSGMLGLSKLWMSAFLPASILPIMVSYFHHSDFVSRGNIYADFHVRGLIFLLQLLVINSNIKIIFHFICNWFFFKPWGYAIWMTFKAYCKSDSIKDLYSTTPGWPQETQSKPQFAHAASFERYVNRTIHQRTEYEMNRF